MPTFLQGDTLFAGDSMTVNLPPFVKVDGVKRMVAKGGIPASGNFVFPGLLQMLQASEGQAALAASKNMVVLIGTNDIASGRSAETIFKTITDIWALGKARGVRVIALTIPPAKGYSGFASNFDAINAKRKNINASILASGIPDAVIDQDKLLGSPGDPDRLASAFDGGDHLHPRKDAHGAALTTALPLAITGVPLVPKTPSQALVVPTESFPWTMLFVLVGIGVGGTILLARKHSGLPLLPDFRAVKAALRNLTHT